MQMLSAQQITKLVQIVNPTKKKVRMYTWICSCSSSCPRSFLCIGKLGHKPVNFTLHCHHVSLHCTSMFKVCCLCFLLEFYCSSFRVHKQHNMDLNITEKPVRATQVITSFIIIVRPSKQNHPKLKLKDQCAKKNPSQSVQINSESCQFTHCKLCVSTIYYPSRINPPK